MRHSLTTFLCHATIDLLSGMNLNLCLMTTKSTCVPTISNTITQVQNGNRKCTDILFLLMLWMAWGAMTILGLIVTGVVSHESLEPGDPRRLLNGIDYDGRICGVDSAVKVRQNISLVHLLTVLVVSVCQLSMAHPHFFTFNSVHRRCSVRCARQAAVDVQFACMHAIGRRSLCG